MAISLETLRSSILDSIKGRKFGLSPTGYLVGAPDNVVPVSQATTATTGTVIDPFGFTGVSSSTNTTWSLAAPVAGVTKQLIATTTSTGTMAVQLASGNFLTTSGSSFNQMSFAALGQSVDLIGLSTALYGVNGLASCTFSTF